MSRLRRRSAAVVPGFAAANPSIERTSSSWLRKPEDAAHVERMADSNSVSARGKDLAPIFLCAKLTILVAGLSATGFAFASEACTPALASEAEMAVAQIHSWQAMRAAFDAYDKCDDGAIGEGFSEAVARVVLGSQPQLETLQRLAEADAAFSSFVLRHVDATLGADQLLAVERIAGSSCPAVARPVCKDLVASARTAMGQQ